jgi:hypothetical protein
MDRQHISYKHIKESEHLVTSLREEDPPRRRFRISNYDV